ncbi:MAG: DNA replication complex GINS family protein [Crenarchaeota archaeon]|nr:DNA replication complex GINS family protein [Thermoproteota archaeon]
MASVGIELLEWIISSELNRIKLEYELEETVAIPQVDSRSLKLPGLGEIPIERGRAIRISRGIASQLADSGLVRLGEEPLTLKDVAAMRWLEAAEESLIKLPDYFYIKAAKLVQTYKDDKKTMIQNDLQEIIDIRVRKMIKLVFLKEPPTSILEKFQPEERFLYNLLREALNGWRRGVMYTDE